LPIDTYYKEEAKEYFCKLVIEENNWYFDILIKGGQNERWKMKNTIKIKKW
jgi:hypothetical protein